MRRLSLCLALAGVASGALAAAPRYGSWGVDTAAMDKAVKPGDDFFAYANGTWLRTATIPADKTATGYNYTLPDEAEAEVRTIAEDAERAPDTPIARQIGDFYAAWMDGARVEARGTAPLRPALAQIRGVEDTHALMRLMAQPGFASPIDLSLQADLKAPTRYAVYATQARLGLPTRDYYLLPGARYDAYRSAYRTYVARILTLAGESDAGARAAAIVALETKLSQAQWTPEQQRDPVATYNPKTRAQLAAFAPQIDWPGTLAAMGLGDTQVVVVGETSAVAAAARMIADTPLATWKDWLTFRFVSDHAAYLPRAFDEARFGFYSRTLRDVPQQRARWKRGVALLDDDLGEAVGQLYVKRHWSAEEQAQVAEMMADMRAAYRDKIEHAAWMDAPTRKVALEKLDSFDPRFGHPVKWVDYSSMTVGRDTLFENIRAAEAFAWRLALSRKDKPIDRSLWAMTPQTVNAYYDPTQNQITVPAAILQPPFFDPAADAAVNYAMTGASTIGHEMGHGFDDQGRQFDPHGTLTDWWTPATVQRYTVKADALAKQFDAYEPIPGVHIKGRLTLGENLADLGGLETAYAAYRRYVARHGDRVVDGYTGDQRFFIAYAQAWQGKSREGAQRQQLLSDPHSPDKYRVDGIVRNFDPWYAAFAVKPGETLYLTPAQRVHLW